MKITTDFYHGLKIEIAEALYVWMEKNKLSKAKAAKILGFSRPYIYEILNGKRNFSLKSLCEMMAKIGMEPVLTFKEAKP